jgi:pentose-5-phosphate-3-epimerase
MVRVTPAPLTSSPETLANLLAKFIAAGFDSIDIDIQEHPFASSSTLSWEQSLEVVEKIDLPDNISLGWDLKLAQPEAAVVAILAQAQKLKRTADRIYVYSTAQIDFVDEIDTAGARIGLGILGSTNPRGVEFLSKFPEVQLMTIHAEVQGSKLDPNLLDRVTEIRDLGYEGLISVDGGINLNSAELINAYAKEVRIDRVSVGSYFQNATDLESAKQKLEIALNIGVEPLT